MSGKALLVQPETQIANLTSTVDNAFRAILDADEHTPIDADGKIVPVVVERTIDLYSQLDRSADRHFVYKGALADLITTGKTGRARVTLREFAERTGEGRVAIGQYRKVIRICKKPSFQRAFMEEDGEDFEPVSGKDFCLMILDNMAGITFTHLRAMTDLNGSLELMALRLKEWARDSISSTAAEFMVKMENGGPAGGRAYYRGLAQVFAIQIVQKGKDKIARVTIDLGVEDEEPNSIIAALKEARAAGRPLHIDCVLRGTKEQD